MSERSVR